MKKSTKVGKRHLESLRAYDPYRPRAFETTDERRKRENREMDATWNREFHERRSAMLAGRVPPDEDDILF